MTAFFSDMLLGRLPTDVPKGRGRTVSFSGSDVDIRLITGTMHERVQGFCISAAFPVWHEILPRESRVARAGSQKH